MYTVTIQSHDRVVTAGRVNSGKESIDGLEDSQVAAVMAGESVHIPSRRGPTAVVEIEMVWETWRHEGDRGTLPDLAAMGSDIERQEALTLWADSSRITTRRF